MGAVKTLLRMFSYLYHGLLALFLLLVSALALGSGAASLHLDMLPWSGATLAWILLAASLFGLIALLLAIAARSRALLPVEPGGGRYAAQRVRVQQLPLCSPASACTPPYAWCWARGWRCSAPGSP